MENEARHSPGPWQWTDFGVLSDANGDALLDYENWQVSPEDAALLAAAPALLDWVTRVVEKYADRMDRSDVEMGLKLMKQAADASSRR